MSLLNRLFDFPERVETKAVYEDDVEDYLESLGKFSELESGELTCVSCGTTITKDNLGTVFPKEGEVAVTCDKSECMGVALRWES
jgi:hypothetical protein